MTDLTLRSSFIVLHLTLGIVIVFESARTLVHAMGAPDHIHLGMLAAVETVAALLFIWPRTMRVGGWALILVFVTAFLAHAVQGELQTSLLIYAAAALFVTVHGSAWKFPSRQPAG